jgi:hypothetical protein
MYITYTIQETGGPYPGILTDHIESTVEYYYHGDLPETTVYRIDNGAQRNGIDQEYTLNIGDLTSASPVPKQLRTFYLEPRGAATLVPSNWDGDALLYSSALRLMKKNARPTQYYEMEIDARVPMSHTLTWESQNYTPINVEINSDGSKVTYVEQIEENPQRDGKFQP